MREVTEADFRMPEYRQAKVEDYEFRKDGALVRKDRWEQGIHSIVGIFEDTPGMSDLTAITRREFEVEDVVAAVQMVVTIINSEPNAEAPDQDASSRAGRIGPEPSAEIGAQGREP